MKSHTLILSAALVLSTAAHAVNTERGGDGQFHIVGDSVRGDMTNHWGMGNAQGPGITITLWGKPARNVIAREKANLAKHGARLIEDATWGERTEMQLINDNSNDPAIEKWFCSKVTAVTAQNTQGDKVGDAYCSFKLRNEVAGQIVTVQELEAALDYSEVGFKAYIAAGAPQGRYADSQSALQPLRDRVSAYVKSAHELFGF